MGMQDSVVVAKNVLNMAQVISSAGGDLDMLMEFR